MQTFEKTIPVLKNETAPVIAMTSDSEQNENRQRLAIVGMPMALVAAFCLFSLAQRTVQGFVDDHTAKKTNQMTMSDAKRIAGSMCLNVTGHTTKELEVSQQAAFSLRRNGPVREWEVLCDAGEGRRYLVRINARTHTIYAINRVDTPASSLAIARPSLPHTSQNELPIEVSQARAKQYLRTCGIPTEGLQFLPDTDGIAALAKENEEVHYENSRDDVQCFTYKHYVPGIGMRMLKVGVNRYTGELEHLWNPVAAL